MKQAGSIYIPPEITLQRLSAPIMPTPVSNARNNQTDTLPQSPWTSPRPVFHSTQIKRKVEEISHDTGHPGSESDFPTPKAFAGLGRTLGDSNLSVASCSDWQKAAQRKIDQRILKCGQQETGSRGDCFEFFSFRRILKLAAYNHTLESGFRHVKSWWRTAKSSDPSPSRIPHNSKAMKADSMQDRLHTSQQGAALVNSS
jgi:hypothetical protein